MPWIPQMYRTLLTLGFVTLSAIVFLSPSRGYAAVQKTDAITLDVATDSLVWALDGYSLILGAEHPEFENFRLHVEIFGLTYPDTFIDLNEANANEGWERVIDQAFMLAVDHHPLDEWPGFHYSAGFNIQSSTITRKGLTGETSFSTFELLLTVGYRFKPVDTWELFVTPYAAIGLPMEISTPDELGGQVFEEPLIQWVGSVRVGWTFPL